MKNTISLIAFLLFAVMGLNAFAAPDAGAKLLPPPMQQRCDAKGKYGDMPHPMRRYFEKLKKENPAEYQRLLQLRRDDRRAFMAEMERLFPRQKNPMNDRLQKIEKECWELARKLKATSDPAEKEKLTAQLQKKLDESCNEMIEYTRKHVERLQKKIDYIEKNRENILEQRFKFFTETTHCPHDCSPEQSLK